MTGASGRKWLILGATWVCAVIAIFPVLFKWTAPAPSTTATAIAVMVAILAAGALCWLFYRAESKRLYRCDAISVVIFSVLLTGLALYMHHFLIDVGTSYFHGLANDTWQEGMQGDVVRLSPSVLPHSYRFLPNAVVYWMQMFRVKFAVASNIYRLLAGMLLFYVLYRYARLYTNHMGGLIAMILAGLVYPISFVGYAGQLTDPLSHLSFVLAFIFLETNDFVFFVTTLLIGSLAKETVLGMLGFYLLFKRHDRHYLVKAAMLCAVCLGMYFGVRMLVLRGAMGYQQVSGVSIHHLWENLTGHIWLFHFLATAGAYVPFLILAWRDTPGALKKMIFYLLPVLWISSWFFSWLNEARNFMPLVFVLAVVAGRYLVRRPSGRDSQSSLPEPLLHR